MPNPITNLKNKDDKFEEINVLILCGGLGTRLASVMADTPKSLAQIKEKTFLDVLMESLTSQGLSRFTLCVGHLRDSIKNRYQNFSNISISEESFPLGTGGAVKNAEKFVKSGDFLVTNGDSLFVGLNLKKFHTFHKQQDSLVSIALASPRKDKDFGGVTLSKDKEITNFAEKNDLDKTRFMNGGVYFMKKEVFKKMPQGPFSLESDLFPQLVSHSLYGFFSTGEVIDIGTPKRYAHAKTILS